MKLSYEIHGDLSYQVVIFLHGFLGTGTDWRDFAQRLSHEYCCVLPDLPGHGTSTCLECLSTISLDATAQGLIDILNELQIEQAVFVGYSMGGRIALLTTLAFPDRVRALVLESANPGIESEIERVARIELDDQRAVELLRDGLEKFVEKWYAAPLFRSLRGQPERLLELKKTRLRHVPDSLAAAFKGLSVGRQQPMWQRLAELRVPTLLFSGSQDETYCCISDRLAAVMPQAQRVTIEGAGHNSHFEKPEEFLARLEEFLNDIGD